MTDYPKVSVVTITYGHEKYITETLDGVLMQAYPGEIEFIIANDNSPDQTDIVIKNYLSTSTIPENFEIKYTKHDANKGMMPNLIWALEHATGIYIALCEGDDYWTDPLKLQKQVDFLEANEDFSMHFHAAKNYTQIKGQFSQSTALETREYTGEEFLRNWLIPTASIIFRRKCFRKVVSNRLLDPNYIFGDIILFLSIAEEGKAYCLNEMMSVYRVHDSSKMRSLGKDSVRRYINHHKHMAKDFGGKYLKINYLIIADAYYSIFIKEKQKSKKRKYFLKYNFIKLKYSKTEFFSKSNLKTFFYHLFYKPFYL